MTTHPLSARDIAATAKKSTQPTLLPWRVLRALLVWAIVAFAQSAANAQVAVFFTVSVTAGPGGTVSPNSSQQVLEGDSVTFNATPNVGYLLNTFTTNSSGCVAARSGTRLTIGSVHANCTVSATFVRASFLVTPTAIGNGSISPSAVQTVLYGDSKVFTLTPQLGHKLGSISGCPGGAGLSGNTYTTGPITTNCTVTATFIVMPIATFHNVSTSVGGAPGGGSVSPTSATVEEGLTTSFVVTPNYGFYVDGVTGCGVSFNGGATPRTTALTITTTAVFADCHIVAYFGVSPTFNVTATAGVGGSINPTSRTVPQGSTAQFIVTPNAGFAINTVTGCGGTRVGSIFTTSPVSADCSVSATFTTTTTAPVLTPMIEFYHPTLDYYFLTSRSNEIALLDATPPWTRTGQRFSTYRDSVPDSSPLTRFYFDRIAVNETRGSHFYTLVTGEVAALTALNPSNNNAPRLPFSEGVDSYAFQPLVEGVGGSCAVKQTPVYRLFRGNARFPDDPNHRFTISTAIYNDFVSRGWDGEGVKFCLSQQEP